MSSGIAGPAGNTMAVVLGVVAAILLAGLGYFLILAKRRRKNEED